MAYNPTLYNPYGFPQGATSLYHGQLQQQLSQPINGLVNVTGMDGAKAYQLPANSCMPLFDSDNDVMYLKTTDGAGFPTIRTFRFEPMDNELKLNADYVNRAEFDAFCEKVMSAINGEQSVSEEQ